MVQNGARAPTRGCMRTTIAILVCAALAAASTAAAPAPRFVFCAPGYPGSTAEAQPSMDTFAAALARAARLPDGGLHAVYHETEQAGVDAIGDPDTAFAIVAYPLFVERGAALGLVPRLRAALVKSGATETWTLVAKKGRVKAPASLAGWELASIAGYAPKFIRDEALARWGALPSDVRFKSSSLVLSALRRAASGDDVAVLLDGAQSEGFASLPFAPELEIVATSPPLPVALACTVRGRIEERAAVAVMDALDRLEETSDGSTALAGLRLTGFVPTSPAPSSERR